jgi:hypothetical protein
MMRDRLLAVKGDTFDPSQVQDKIEEVARAFGDYLAQTGQRGNSKHRALGAVGKALQHARSVRGEALFGYVRRVHEQVTGKMFPTAAVLKLDEGLQKLDALLADPQVPPRAAGEILSRINYATYYYVRKRQQDFFSGWESLAREKMTSMRGSPGGKPPTFKEAREGKPSPEWKKIAEDYLASTKIADALADDEEEEK